MFHGAGYEKGLLFVCSYEEVQYERPFAELVKSADGLANSDLSFPLSSCDVRLPYSLCQKFPILVKRLRPRALDANSHPANYVWAS